MKLRDTVIVVALAHVGLVLVWVCMGGCAKDKATEPESKVAVLSPGAAAGEMPPAATDVLTKEVATPITIEPLRGERFEEGRLPSKAALPEPGQSGPSAEAGKVAEPSTREITIVVKPGDTLWALSRKYHVPISVIADRNDIQDDHWIRAGRELIIPLSGAAAEEPEPEAEMPVTPSTTPAPPSGAASEAVPAAEGGEPAVHRVESGDTVWSLARKYHTTPVKIMEANNITDPTRLQVGQELHIPR